MGKSSIPPPVGEVVLVQKKPEPAVEKPKIREISHKEYEKLRPKKELSEKQKENLAKLVEKNKQRALERRAVVKDAVPESVPEDKELVVVKPKRKYVRKVKPEPKNEVVVPSEPETTTESESEVERKPLPMKRVNTKPKKNTRNTPKKPTKYKYESETTSQDDWSDGDDSDDDYEDHKVKKYQAKAQARLQAVHEIDKRMSQIQGNTYVSRGLSVF